MMNYKQETKKARKLIDPLVREIKGLCFIAFSLESTAKLSQHFADNIEKLDLETCLAFTKAIAVDYGRLWKHGQNQFVRKLDKSFYCTDTSVVHGELIQIRDKLVAHVDKGYETLAAIFDGTTVINDFPHEVRHDDVFIPFSLRGEGKGFMWWINNKETAVRINDHIIAFKKLTYERLRDKAQECLRLAQQNAHVLKEMRDIVQFREFEDKGGGERRQLDAHEGGLVSPEPKDLAIGRMNLAATVSIYQSGVCIPCEDVRGTGYVLRMDGSKYTVSFIDHTPRQ